MTLKLTKEKLHAAMPKAPEAIIEVFVRKQAILDKSGITDTPKRLASFFANLAHETNQFRIRGLKENLHYSATGMAKTWPNRFNSAYDVERKYGTSPGWQKKAFDDIYGNRMGNRPGTHDGSTYIGRGGPQWTGREGYEELEKRTGLPAIKEPDSVCEFEYQPEVSAAYWDWKRMNDLSDKHSFRSICIRWNGGTIGYSSRVAYFQQMLPIFESLSEGKGEPIPLPKRRPKAGPPAGSLLAIIMDVVKAILAMFTKGK